MYIYCDIDGVLTPPNKIFYCINNKLQKAKMFSDCDSYAIEKHKDNITFVTHDNEINAQWALRRGVKCIVVPNIYDKFDYLYSRLWMRNYIYIGDTMHDFLCLKYAKKSYVPMSASYSLLNSKIREHLTVVPIEGGCGVLDWVCHHLDKEQSA